jgi:hypothetical protein
MQKRTSNAVSSSSSSRRKQIPDKEDGYTARRTVHHQMISLSHET